MPIPKPLTSTSRNVAHGKNMSQNESPPPLGRKPYFMSVMYAWSSRNGIIQNADSNPAAASTQTPYLNRVRSM